MTAITDTAPSRAGARRGRPLAVVGLGHVRLGRRDATHLRRPRPASAILVAGLALLALAIIFMMSRPMAPGGLLYRLGAPIAGASGPPAVRRSGRTAAVSERSPGQARLRPATVDRLRGVAGPVAVAPEATKSVEAPPADPARAGLTFLSPDFGAALAPRPRDEDTGEGLDPGFPQVAPAADPLAPTGPAPAGPDPGDGAPRIEPPSIEPTETLFPRPESPPIDQRGPVVVPLVDLGIGGPPAALDGPRDPPPPSPPSGGPGFAPTPGPTRFVPGEIVRDVGAVPEPATWLMMIVGFLATGTALRRRQYA